MAIRWTICWKCENDIYGSNNCHRVKVRDKAYNFCVSCFQEYLEKTKEFIRPERSKREDSRNWISFDEQEPFCFNSVFLTDGKKVWFDKSYEWSTYSSEYAEDKGPTHWISPLSLLPFIEESLKKRFICQHPCEMRCSEHCGNTVRDK